VNGVLAMSIVGDKPKAALLEKLRPYTDSAPPATPHVASCNEREDDDRDGAED
jgi:hypothetical protein